MSAILRTPVGVRWTIGNVNPRGFEALRLSIHGACRLFGRDAAYAVCVNGLSTVKARELTGPVPEQIRWIEATEVPAWIRPHLDAGMAEGVAWKFAPLQMFTDRYEIALDNDCILWRLPEAMQRWLSGDFPDRCLLAEDVRTCAGVFADLCGPEPRNSGIRGLPPDFDFEQALRSILAKRQAMQVSPLLLTSELDEQGLQTAAVSLPGPPLCVSIDDVTVCSPFYPHRPDLGHCGAHFVGLNARHIAWDYYDRPADELMTEHWARHRPALYQQVGARITAVA